MKSLKTFLCITAFSLCSCFIIVSPITQQQWIFDCNNIEAKLHKFKMRENVSSRLAALTKYEY